MGLIKIRLPTGILEKQIFQVMVGGRVVVGVGRFDVDSGLEGIQGYDSDPFGRGRSPSAMAPSATRGP